MLVRWRESSRVMPPALSVPADGLAKAGAKGADVNVGLVIHVAWRSLCCSWRKTRGSNDGQALMCSLCERLQSRHTYYYININSMSSRNFVQERPSLLQPNTISQCHRSVLKTKFEQTTTSLRSREQTGQRDPHPKPWPAVVCC